jgi:excinuclease ABC subunit C
MTARKDVIARIRNKIRDFPAGPGLYFMKGSSDVVLYIGKAKNLRSRAGSYFQPGADIDTSRGPKIAELLRKVEDVDFLETESEIDAILQEARLIKDIHPIYNSQLTDDKTFPYLEITKEDYPAVYITRNPRDGSKLFGPFTAVSELRWAIVVLQKIFRFRTCKLEILQADPKRQYFRPCILHSIKQCTAPCADRISKADYGQSIKDLVKFLNSKRTAILRELAKEMQDASANLEFEKAAGLRDRIRLIEKLAERGSVEDNVQPEAFASDPADALIELQKVLGMDEPIRIIEGIDIAHIQGTDTVGSLVKFIDGKPFKAGYRRFKINTVKGVDDFASIYEVVSRRYKHAADGEELWPDLVLIDGGLGQLSAARDAFKKIQWPMPKLISLAKREEEIFTLGSSEPIRLKATSPARKLLQYVRDESHRFAQHYHHLLQKKRLLNE